jgi:RND superfamily putative drug exporter
VSSPPAARPRRALRLGLSSALIGIAAAVVDVPEWAPAVASLLGIGVGIDYALLV